MGPYFGPKNYKMRALNILLPCISAILNGRRTKIRMIKHENIHKYCREDMWITSHLISVDDYNRQLLHEFKAVVEFVYWIPWKYSKVQWIYKARVYHVKGPLKLYIEFSCKCIPVYWLVS